MRYPERQNYDRSTDEYRTACTLKLVYPSDTHEKRHDTKDKRSSFSADPADCALPRTNSLISHVNYCWACSMTHWMPPCRTALSVNFDFPCASPRGLMPSNGIPAHWRR
jgi:hypothetical protein